MLLKLYADVSMKINEWRLILCLPYYNITLQLVNPAFQDVLGHIRWGILEKFKASFDKALGIASSIRDVSSKLVCKFDKLAIRIP